MGRPATGNVKWLYNAETGVWQWHARFTVAGKRTPFAPIEVFQRDAIERAKECAKTYAEAFKGAVPEGVETVAEYARRWLASREARVVSIADERARMTKHVLPIIGLRDVKTIGREQLEKLRDDLDRKIVKGELAWKTAASVWTLVTGMFDDAMNAKLRTLRMREDNPCRDVRAPDRGARKAKQFLFPSEFLAFVSCERVPLEWRRAVAIAVYTYTRDGELRAFRWDEGDIDLDHGVLSVTRAHNRRTGGTKGTKTDAPRRFVLEGRLLPLLRAMHTEAKGKGAVVRGTELHMARGLRRWLTVAGVNRPELHKGTPTRKPMTWHDLRATGITWCAIRGDDALKIMKRAGHSSFSTTEIYVREAENLREGFGDVFPALPACLLGKGAPEASEAPQGLGRVSDSEASRSRKSLKNRQNWSGTRVSNP